MRQTGVEMKHKILLLLGWAVGLMGLAGCALIPAYSHVNTKQPGGRLTTQYQVQEVASASYLASYDVPWDLDPTCRNQVTVALAPPQAPPVQPPALACPRTNRDFVGLAMSGGGSRAAVFSAAVLFELQRYGLLQQADVMSSVSGGSFAAAFYALSCDNPANCPITVEGPPRFLWTPDVAFPLLERDFLLRWVGNVLWPKNLALTTFTYYNRTAVMAETLSDNLFDNSRLGGEGFRLHDLNPQRPSVILNATDNTSSEEDGEEPNDANFGFTKERFDRLDSDLDQYPVASAVMASATFPGVFNYLTLRDYAQPSKRYIHLYDGGTSDNLGLAGVHKVLDVASQHPQWGQARKLVLLIDAYVPAQGRSGREPDPREGIDYLVDTNFLDAYDSLMSELRTRKVEQMKARLKRIHGDLYHLEFGKLNGMVGQPKAKATYDVVKTIPTSLRIECEQAQALREAARLLVEDLAAQLRADPKYKDMLLATPLKPLPHFDTCVQTADDQSQ
ncbi:MAG: patatin-like phospholipase family protein [Nitrospirota bacterium]|nr:patatin-like phospholipase family protein [Nitrospirota bacterium]